MDLFKCLVTVFKWIKHEKEEKKMKTKNVGKFHKPAKIFAGVAKFRRAPAFKFCTELQSAITRPNSDSCVLGLYGKFFESRI